MIHDETALNSIVYATKLIEVMRQWYPGASMNWLTDPKSKFPPPPPDKADESHLSEAQSRLLAYADDISAIEGVPDPELKEAFDRLLARGRYARTCPTPRG